ncbi:UNKNOWN [Stylonychia lemnae]|uniref:Uncharacterized protein n=1 Tax=Stylonychia lemnae TaxID=5949 RepID=A0A078A1V2_STYLE|nr:UNKNOWN [Stylonychia lemnae]|eukprot:CDW74769.1 UNKNOWN [Stylonychia lemnae]
MIKKDSKEWENFVSQIEYIKTKSNRQVLCAKCWLMLNYEQKIKHLKENPDHENSILTSAKFATAQQMISLAQACNKLVYKNDGQYIISPFIGVTRHILESQDSPDTMPNNSSSSAPLQGSSRSNDSQNGNSENDDNQIKLLSNRLNAIESTVENIQKSLNVFAQCLQNTHVLQQRILDQMKLQSTQGVPQSPSLNHTDQSFQNFLSQNQNQLNTTFAKPKQTNGATQNNGSPKSTNPINDNDKNQQNYFILSLQDLGQDMIRGQNSQYIYKQTTKHHYESSDSLKSEGKFNPFKQKNNMTFQPESDSKNDQQEESVVQQMSGDQFFDRLSQNMQFLLGKRLNRSFDKESSEEDKDKESIMSQASKKNKL